MKTLTTALLLGILWILAGGLSAAEQSAKRIQPVYTIHTINDTIWWRFGDTLLPAVLTKMHSPDTSHITSVDSTKLVLYSGQDTIVIPPSSEMIRIWMTSPKDSILELLFFTAYTVDSGKIELLRKYGQFGGLAAPPSISFVYPEPSDSALTNLRTTYNLDSIAGTGDEFSRKTNLLHWVHFAIRHDGNSNIALPQPPTAANILAAAIHDHRAFYCGVLGWVLTDVYNAIGFKSRFLGCLPFDTLDQDSHGLTMVWSNDLHKWLMMDPTFDVWFTDTLGVPLSPMEIRARMATGDSVRMADCMNWNGQPRDKLPHYNYMAKNLFRMRTGARWKASPGQESRFIDLWLIPDGYRDDLLGVVDLASQSGQVTYHTDNADWFFAPPQ